MKSDGRLVYRPIRSIFHIFAAGLNINGGGNTYKYGNRHYGQEFEKVHGHPDKVACPNPQRTRGEVQTPDGEIFKMWSDLAKYDSGEDKNYILHLIEFIFDRNFSDDKEKIINRISWEFMLNAVPSMGLDEGNRQNERVRIGKRIKELREAKKMEARDLALLAALMRRIFPASNRGSTPQA